MKAKHDIRNYESCAASNDASSEHGKEDRNRAQKIKFDTDYFPIGSYTYSGFETCVPNNRNNKGRIKVADGGSMEVKGRGTVTWKLDDDDGVVHNINIKDTLYVPKLDRCLLSPQHVAQELEK